MVLKPAGAVGFAYSDIRKILSVVYLYISITWATHASDATQNRSASVGIYYILIVRDFLTLPADKRFFGIALMQLINTYQIVTLIGRKREGEAFHRVECKLLDKRSIG